MHQVDAKELFLAIICSVIQRRFLTNTLYPVGKHQFVAITAITILSNCFRQTTDAIIALYSAPGLEIVSVNFICTKAVEIPMRGNSIVFVWHSKDDADSISPSVSSIFFPNWLNQKVTANFAFLNMWQLTFMWNKT